MTTLDDVPFHRVGAPLVGTTKAMLDDPITFHMAPWRKYGSLYRMHFLGRTQLVMAGLAANEFIWQQDHPWDYKAPFGMFLDAYGPTAMTQLEGEAHRAKRRRLGAAMRPKVMSELAPIMYELAVEHLQRAVGRTVDLQDFCGSAVVHMQSRALFNLRLDPGLESELSWIEQFNLFGWLFGPLRRFVWRYPRYRNGTARIEQILGAAVDDRLANPSDDPDLLSVVVATMAEEGTTVPRQELIMELKELLFAGSSTLSNQLAWSILYLAQRPDWTGQLREELEDFDPAGFHDLHDCPRLMATVLEVQRLRPAGAFFPRIAGRDFEFEGVHVPAGTHVHHATLVPHLDPEIFERPEEFVPERFLGDHATYPAKWNSIFGGGPHMCLGRPLALVEGPMALAALLREFEADVDTVSMRARIAPNLVPRERHIGLRVSRR